MTCQRKCCVPSGISSIIEDGRGLPEVENDAEVGEMVADTGDAAQGGDAGLGINGEWTRKN